MLIGRSFTDKRLVTKTYEILPRAVEAKASIAIGMSESLITFFIIGSITHSPNQNSHLFTNRNDAIFSSDQLYFFFRKSNLCDPSVPTNPDK